MFLFVRLISIQACFQLHLINLFTCSEIHFRPSIVELQNILALIDNKIKCKQYSVGIRRSASRDCFFDWTSCKSETCAIDIKLNHKFCKNVNKKIWINWIVLHTSWNMEVNNWKCKSAQIWINYNRNIRTIR